MKCFSIGGCSNCGQHMPMCRKATQYLHSMLKLHSMLFSLVWNWKTRQPCNKTNKMCKLSCSLLLCMENIFLTEHQKGAQRSCMIMITGE